MLIVVLLPICALRYSRVGGRGRGSTRERSTPTSSHLSTPFHFSFALVVLWLWLWLWRTAFSTLRARTIQRCVCRALSTVSVQVPVFHFISLQLARAFASIRFQLLSPQRAEPFIISVATEALSTVHLSLIRYINKRTRRYSKQWTRCSLCVRNFTSR